VVGRSADGEKRQAGLSPKGLASPGHGAQVGIDRAAHGVLVNCQALRGFLDGIATVDIVAAMVRELRKRGTLSAVATRE
jgi:hypothetical protein